MFHANGDVRVASGSEAYLPLNEIYSSAQALFGNSKARVGKIRVGGHCYWAKRPGNQSWLNRLQKGPAKVAFEREIEALKIMKAIGAPVPREVLRRPNLIVFHDAGPTLQHILRFQLLERNERILACEKAALALASLHKSGVNHGRPLLRDICWDGKNVTFLDFENYRVSRNNPRGHAHDLVRFVFSMYAQRNVELPEIDAAVLAYRAADTTGVWDAAARWARRNRWFDWLSWPIRQRRYPHAREYKAIPMVLDHLTDNRSDFPS